MKLNSALKILLVFSVISCNTNRENEFFTIQVDSVESAPLSLSEIASKIEAVELEVTDNSLISRENRVLYTGEHIFIAQRNTVMLFDKTGKFLRQIGSVGQGPGEFTAIIDITADVKNKYLYINARNKMICYDFDGNLIKNTVINKGDSYVNYQNGKLLLLTEMFGKSNGKNIGQAFLYMLDDNLSKSDSVKVYEIPITMAMFRGNNDFISNDGENTYLYYSDITTNSFLLDTLYQFKNNKLIPYLNLGFSNNGLTAGQKNIYIMNIYKSSRYVFSFYQDQKGGQNQWYYFCYDIKTGKSYKVKDGYTDDIHTGEKVKIRPFDSDANLFYYLHTNIDDSAKEEPNPTLYIGTLKK